MGTIDEYMGFRRSLLPLEKMRAIADEKATAYQTASPFPHIVLDDLFDPVILEQVLKEFPGRDEIDWGHRQDETFEVKLSTKAEGQIGLFTRYFIYALNSASFLNFLEKLTGIEGLIPDPHLWGGGLHQIMPGGKLGVHADFNKYKRLALDRRLNVLIYLNHDWREEWGGHFELWPRDMKAARERLLPVFNRMVCFSTTDFSFHGHPDALKCPPDRSRRSLALYYYSNGRPAEEVSGDHSTMFQHRPTDHIPLSERLNPRTIARKLIPPIVLDIRRMIIGPPPVHPEAEGPRKI